jgi:hypothetical protein
VRGEQRSEFPISSLRRDTAEQHAKDGIFMSPTERTLNSRLLHEALPIYETKLQSPKPF